MIRSLLYLFLQRVLRLFRPEDHVTAEAEIEIAVLRHQLTVLRRQVKRPVYRASDRFGNTLRNKRFREPPGMIGKARRLTVIPACLTQPK